MSAFSAAFDSAFDSPSAPQLDIPPEIVYGPISVRVDDIVERVTENLHGTDGDPWIASAVDSAIWFVIQRTGRYEVGLSDVEWVVNGLVGFAARIFLDQFAPAGMQGALGDLSFGAFALPNDPYIHAEQYFSVLNISWGVA